MIKLCPFVPGRIKRPEARVTLQSFGSLKAAMMLYSFFGTDLLRLNGYILEVMEASVPPVRSLPGMDGREL